MAHTYIKKDVRGYYTEMNNILPSDLFDNLGETYEDFLDNKWVLLSEEQVLFHQEHPEATIKEVLEMELAAPYVRTLEDAKREMLVRISNYDVSENVNSFTINNVISTWFTVEERSNYANSINAAELLGIEKLSFYVGDNSLEVPTASAKQMLASIQLYADACYIVTKGHEAAVNTLGSIEEVDSYNYMEGYPKKLNFDLV